MRWQGRAVKLFPPPLCASPTHTPVLLGVGCEEQVGLRWSLFLAKGRGPPGHVRVRDTLPTEPRAWSQLRLSLHRRERAYTLPARDSGQLDPAGQAAAGKGSCRHFPGHLRLA